MTLRKYVGQQWDQGGAKITSLGAPTTSTDAATKGYVDGLAPLSVTITYTGTAWPARTTVTVPTGGYVVYDSSAYPGAPQPSDWTGTDVWLQNTPASTSLLTKHVAWFAAAPASATATAIGIVLSAIGTITAVGGATTNIYTRMRKVAYRVTTAATTAIAGFYQQTNSYSVLSGFIADFKFGADTGAASAATRRWFVGFTSSVSAPTDVEPNTINDILGVGALAADTNLFFMHRTGSGTVIRSDTGMAKPTADGTDMYDLSITVLPGATTATMRLTRLSDGSTISYTTTTAIPASTTMLSPRGVTSVGGTSSVIGFGLSGLYIETAV